VPVLVKPEAQKRMIAADRSTLAMEAKAKTDHNSYQKLKRAINWWA